MLDESTRLQLMRRVFIFSLLSASLGLCGPESRPTEGGFGNGVAAGEVTRDSAVLWTRLLAPGPVTFALATNTDWAAALFRDVTNVTDSESPMRVEVTGLAAGTRYFYRVTDAQGHDAIGQFRTAQPQSSFFGLRFGVSGDWRGELAPFPSIGNAAGRNLDFFVELGDTIYADYPSPALTNAQALTLADFQVKHSEVYSAHLGLNSLADLRASTAVWCMLDDHEVINNFAGGALPASDTRFASDTQLDIEFINETDLYQNGLRAFQEYNPIRLTLYDTPDDPRTHGKPKLYRTQAYGRDARMFLLDTRSFRDAGLPSVTNPLDTAGLQAFNARTFDLDPVTGASLAHRTLLGQAQLSELKADLLLAKNEGSLWKVVFIPEPIQSLGFADAPDRYEGYARERTELLQFIAEQKIRNVVFVTADIHGTVVNNVSYQAGPNQPLVPSGAFEVVTGPVAFAKPFGPTAFDVADGIQIAPGLTLLRGLLNYVELPNRAAFDALPLGERDRLFQSIMDIQLTTFGLDATGLDGSDIQAALLAGGYVAAHTYGWTEFEVDPITHWLTVTTYGIPWYGVDEVNASILSRVPQTVSQFIVLPQSEPPNYPALSIEQQNGEIRISWPAQITNGVLQAWSPAQGSWQDASLSMAVKGDLAVVSEPAMRASRVYRLRSR